MRRPELDCMIIGGGPAGLTSALYLKRFKRKIALIQSGTPRAAWIPKTRNLIGYHGGISGPALLARLHRQVGELGVPILEGKAVVTRAKNGFHIEFADRRLLTRKVILATGIRDLQPDIPNLADLRHQGLLRYCPICDGFEHSGKKLILLVGKSDSFGKIRFLLRYTPYLLVIGPKGYRPSARRVNEYRRLKVKYVRGEVKRIAPFRRGIRVELVDGKAFVGDAAYVELGFRVNDHAIRSIKKLRRTKKGCLITDKDQQTSVPGLFAVGDCTHGLAQIAVAAGQAAVAATAVHNDLLDGK